VCSAPSGVQCIVWWMVGAVYSRCRASSCVQRVVYAAGGGCSACGVYVHRVSRAVRCVQWVPCVCAAYHMRSGGCRVWHIRCGAWWLQCMVGGAVYGRCSSVTRGQCTVRCAGYYMWRVVGAVYGLCACIVCRVQCTACGGTSRVVRGCAWCVGCCA
jgi:hypothetical protein